MNESVKMAPETNKRRQRKTWLPLTLAMTAFLNSSFLNLQDNNPAVLNDLYLASGYHLKPSEGIKSSTKKQYLFLAKGVAEQVKKTYLPERLFLTGELTCPGLFVYHWEKMYKSIPMGVLSLPYLGAYKYVDEQNVHIQLKPVLRIEDGKLVWKLLFLVDVTLLDEDTGMFVKYRESWGRGSFKNNPCAFAKKNNSPNEESDKGIKI